MSTVGPPQGAKAPLGGRDPRVAGERGGARARLQRRPVHGVLLLDKPIGLSSNDALQKVKWLLRAEKAGHTGTLDPLATGVLPLCFGAATKFSQLHLDADKSYEAIALLGETTTTGDAEGEIIHTTKVNVQHVDIERVRDQFTGAITQIPPMHSALKKDGKALYEYARAGQTVEREARHVQIRDLHLSIDAVHSNQLHIRTTCSKGTYIRTLGEDIGQALGCGAHLIKLRRTQTGPFDLSRTVTLERLIDMSEEERMACLLPVDALLQGFSRIDLNDEDAGRFLSGVRRRGQWQVVTPTQIAVYSQSPSSLLGTGHVTAGELIPNRLLNPEEIAQILLQPNAFADK